MKNLRTIAAVLCAVALFILASSAVYRGRETAGDRFLRLTHWEYFQPDSSSRQLASHPEGGVWTSTLPSRAYGDQAAAPFRQRISLPAWNGSNPALFLSQVDAGFEVFHRGKKIFELGDPSSPVPHFIGWNQNLIPLPSCAAGEYVEFLPHASASGFLFIQPVLFGASGDFTRTVFTLNAVNMAFALLFFAAGLVFFGIYAAAIRSAIIFGIAMCLTSVSVFIGVNLPFLQLMYPHPLLYYHLDYASFFVATTAGFFSIEKAMAGRGTAIIRTIWQVHALVLIGGTTAIAGGFLTYAVLLPWFLLLVIVNMTVSTVILIRNARTEAYTMKVLAAGIVGFFLLGALEIVLFSMYGGVSDFGYTVRVVPLGVLIFIISLAWLAINEYTTMYKRQAAARQQELDVIRREKELQQTYSMKLLELQEQERNRIALGLHDSIGQKLLLIVNQLSALIRHGNEPPAGGKLQQIHALTREAIQEVRTISYDLRPRHLDQLGLTTALGTLVRTVQESSNLRLHASIDSIDGCIPREREIDFYRIVQEALNNVIKHSGAEEAAVTITKTEAAITLDIRDNGSGIAASPHPGGMGLTGMHERALLLGAALTVGNAEPAGTCVRLTCPISRSTP